MEQNERECPICRKILKHSTVNICRSAEKNKRPCRKCSKPKQINVTRICPRCHEEATYKNTSIRNVSEKRGLICNKCRIKDRIEDTRKRCKTEEYRKKLSIASSGKNNKMYGKTVYDIWIEKYGKEEADRKLEEFKKKMSIINSSNGGNMKGKTVYGVWMEKYGKEEADRRMFEYKQKQSINSKGENNPMYGKISPQGSGNGWSGWYKEKFFRSLRELSFMIELENNGDVWETAECRKYMMPYTDPLGTERNYFADFIVNNEYMVDVKPKRLWRTPLVTSKLKAAIVFCSDNGLRYRLKDPETIKEEQILQLIESGLLKFTATYQKKFEERMVKIKERNVA